MGDKILSKIDIGKTTIAANLMLFRLAYTLGSTSPNNKIKNVTKTTSTTNLSKGDAISENSLSSENENNNTMAMCKKLLAIKMVANNFLGFDNRFSTAFDLVGLIICKSFKSFCESENKATSEAATRAQQKSSSVIPINPTSKSVLRA